MNELKHEQLLHELRSFRRQLNAHDSLTRSNEAINQFLKKDGQEITITLKADTCASEINVTVNGEVYKSHDHRGFDLHELVRYAISEQSK